MVQARSYGSYFKQLFSKNPTGMRGYKPQPSFILNYSTKVDNKKLQDLCHRSNVTQSLLHFFLFHQTAIIIRFTSVKVLQGTSGTVRYFQVHIYFLGDKLTISSLIDCCCLWYVRLETKSSLLNIFENVEKEAGLFEISKFSDNILLDEIFASCVYHFLSLAYKSLKL